MNYKPFGKRVIVKILNAAYKKSAGGLITNTEDEKTQSKNNLIKATLFSIGSGCDLFEEGNIGLTVLIHEIGGVPMAGVDPDYRIMRQEDIWAFSTVEEVDRKSVV